jgi:hypothetical protein
VGVAVRVPQHLGQTLRELVGDGVLQTLGSSCTSCHE